MGSEMRRSHPDLATLCRGAVLLCILHCFQLSLAQDSTLPNCSYPAVYAFGDSLTDTGNAIAAFPDQYAHAELDPNGLDFPTHAADRLCDGKLFVDFLAFGVRRRPIYAVLRGTAGTFTYGTNFAASGATARNTTLWVKNSGFNTPFSLEVQLQWLYRYRIRLAFYENQNPVVVWQSLPNSTTLNSSLYLVYAGYQDYFFSLYDKRLSPPETAGLVPEVVDAINNHIEGVVAFGAQDILVVNLPPLGCIPAMLTLYQDPDPTKYDSHGCLIELNNITSAHNLVLGEKVNALRAKYPALKLYYGDAYGVYTDILNNPQNYNVTEPLKACCGAGGAYNFNKEVTCGHAGTFENQLVNLTSVTSVCADRVGHLSWDGIHTSNTFNKAIATAFLTGKYITPEGGFKCFPDFKFWNSRY